MIDLRGFVYPLESVRRKSAWELEAAQAKLGRAQAALDDGEQALQKMKDSLTAEAREASRIASLQFDIGHHQRCLAYLNDIQQRIRWQEGNVSALRDARDAARRHYMTKQQKMDMMDEHRKVSLNEYRSGEQNRMSAEADRDWNARTLSGMDLPHAEEPENTRGTL